jgi:prevent-host-death family protein
METFTVRDLRERTGELIRDAEAGQLAVVTKHGRPVFVAVPFDERLLRESLPLALAMRLYEAEVVSLGKAARLAEVPLETLIEKLGEAGIPVTRYESDELAQELADVAAWFDP